MSGDASGDYVVGDNPEAEAHREGRHAGAEDYFANLCPECRSSAERPLRVLSLGAGVQSTTVLLMS